MHLEGSCHCGAVHFSLESKEPVPFMRCYCGICRKTAGGGGYLVNLGGDASSLVVDGEDHVRVYRAQVERDGVTQESTHARYFCQQCGSHLYAMNSRWPELVHPVAAAIDTPLPAPPSVHNMMLEFKANWVEVSGGEEHARYPNCSLAEWHKKNAPDL